MKISDLLPTVSSTTNSLLTYREPETKNVPETNAENDHNLWATTDALEESYYDPALDNRKLTTDDTRKAKLTLRHLNRLNQHKKAKVKELTTKAKRAAVVYGSNTDEPNDDDTRKVKQTITDKPDKETGRINREVKTEREVKIKESVHPISALHKAYDDNQALELYGLFFDISELDQEIYGRTSRQEIRAAVKRTVQGFENAEPVYCDIDHGDDAIISELHRTFGVLQAIHYTDGKIYGKIRLLPDNANARQLLDIYAVSGEIPISMRSAGLADNVQITGFDAVSEPAIASARCHIRKVQ